MTTADPPRGRRPAAATTGATPIEDSVTPLIRAVALVSRISASAITRVRIEGALDRIPREGPVILAANHASNLDPVVLGAWLVPTLGRRLQMLGKKELFDWPIIGRIARHIGVHPVDRSTADVEAFRLINRILDEGHILLVFPEGTRSRDGALQMARDGVAVLALRTGATIVPIGVSDSDSVWPRGRKLPRPGGHVTVRVGTPFRLADEVPVGTDRRAAKGLATGVLMHRIAALLPERQRGEYATPEGVEGEPVR